MTLTATLAPLRAHAGSRRTAGLDDATLARLAPAHPDLVAAVDAAAAAHDEARADLAELLELDEDALHSVRLA